MPFPVYYKSVVGIPVTDFPLYYGSHLIYISHPCTDRLSKKQRLIDTYIITRRCRVFFPVYFEYRIWIQQRDPLGRKVKNSGKRTVYFSNTLKEKSTAILLCPFTNEYMPDFAFSSIFLVIILNNIGANRLISVRSASLFLCSFSSSISSGVRLILARYSVNEAITATFLNHSSRAVCHGFFYVYAKVIPPGALSAPGPFL